MKKMIFAAMAILVLNAFVSSNAFPCSMMASHIYWPTDGQTGVPTNGKILGTCFNTVCDSITVSLFDVSNNEDVTLELTEIVNPGDSYVSQQYAPQGLLKASTNYKITYDTGYDTTEIAFTTGNAVDNEPPTVDKGSVTVTIDWSDDHETALIMSGGMCGPMEYTEEEINNNELLREGVEESDYLPEHYNIDINIASIVDDTNDWVFTLKEVNSDGSETVIDDNGLNIPMIFAEDAGASKTYRIEIKDVLDNVQPEQIEFTINFNKANSSYSVNGGGNGGGGEDGSTSGGCSLSVGAQDHNATASLAIFMVLITALAALRKRSLL